MELRLRTLTPLWTGGLRTGGLAGACDRLHETGIIGSLRWWYEAVIRGLEGFACDPTAHSCTAQNPCEACQLFGCTGRGGKFRLQVEGSFVRESGRDVQPTCTHSSHSEPFRAYVPLGLQSDQFTLRIIPLRQMGLEEEKLLKFSLKMMVERAGFGARNQLGYGLVTYSDPKEKDKLSIESLPSVERRTSQPLFPNLRDFFFGVVPVPTGDLVELVDIKCQLRSAFRANPLFGRSDPREIRHLRHLLLGTTRPVRICPDCLGEVREDRRNARQYYCFSERKTFPEGSAIFLDKMASKIFMSQPLKEGANFVLRMWGWVPSRLPYSVSRSDVVKEIHRLLPGSSIIDLGQGGDYANFLKSMGVTSV